MPPISIIVPVYNVEKYLHRCIDSILAQTFTDFELILVDDGSPDGCGAICDEYARQDARVIVIHQENGGVSCARNAGLDRASGTYVAFMDSDDYAGEDWLEDLYNGIETSEAEYEISGYIVADENGEEQKRVIRRTGNWGICSETERIDYLIHNVLHNGNGWELWTSMFCNEIIQRERIRFCTACENFAEDLGFTLEYLLYCERAVAIDACDYYYTQHKGSMMASSASVVKLNAVNEVAYQFGKRFFQLVQHKSNRRKYAILYYFIMQNQYSKLELFGENCAEALKETMKIHNIQWHDRWMRRLYSQRKVLENILGKREMQIAVLNTRLLTHRNYKRFCLEDAIAWRFFIK